MTLTRDRLAKSLGSRPFRFYERVDSTNDLALDWLAQGASAGSIVLADEQIKGRGRAGRTWYTPPGTAIILTIILRPKPEQLSQITMLGALAVYEMLKQVGASDVGIKWPNDVQLNGRKVCGVLPEAVWQGEHLVGVVLGMGINVRIDFSATELADKAVSIEPALNMKLDRIDLLVSLLARMDYWANHLGTQTLFGAWENRLNTLGQNISLQSAGQDISGIAEAVDEAGVLLVRDARGDIHRILAGDVALGSMG